MVFYSDDDDNDNSITIEWGLDGDNFNLGTQVSGVHPASPYTYTITPLDNSKTYQIRVTITDPDNVPTDNVRVYTGRKAYNPLLHNAVSTGSGTDKWATGWGIAEGQYGEFSCAVCHQKKSGNIKRIRKDWSDGSLPDVPAKTNTQTVVFDSTLDGSAQFALDDSTDHASSNRICEACHTKTAHHRYDVSALGATDHQSSKDCVSCHKHQNAFAPSGGCSSCHGGSTSGLTENNFWPDSTLETSDASGSANDAGEHVKHMSVLADKVLGLTLAGLLDDADSANKQLQLCDYCHALPGSDADHMSGDDAEVTRFLRIGDGAIDSATAGTFNYNYTDTTTATCSSVDCHNNKTTPASFAWYQGATSSCVMCHSEDGSNSGALIDPSSGLHYHASPGLVELHDSSFATGSGNCLSCHQSTPSTGHFNSVADAASVTTYNFQTTAINVKLNDLADTTDDTCAANCHSDGGAWYRFWSADAFDSTAFDTSTGVAITTTLQNALPARCRVCHGEFATAWAEGTAHFNMEADNTSSGASHNSQNPNFNPGAACVDCHLYPDHMTPGQGLVRHENGKITLTDDQTAPDEYTPYDDQTGTRTGVYCADCHEATVSPRDGNDANTFEYSLAFPGWANVEVVASDRNPIYTCFSGANGCHGDTTNNWWPNVDSSDPLFYPNREGAHYEHGTTIGELLAEQMNQAFPGSRIDADGNGRVDAIQEDRNKTCNFCHPMAWNSYKEVWESLYHRTNTPETGTVVTDVFGGYIFNGADKKGVYSSGNPVNAGEWSDIDTNSTTGFAYQLEANPLDPGKGIYPLDHDGEYWQYLEDYKADSSVRHGVCSNVACHSNSPFTPQWYGDYQAPGQITNLTASTNNTDVLVHDIYEYDEPGSVHLYWTAPGDNGHFSGTADEYDVYYRPVANGVITSGNLADGTTKRAGGASTVLRQGEQQEMMVEGLTPGVAYNFALVTKDQPHYKDLVKPGDEIYETLVEPANLSPVSNNASAVAHTDNVVPIFWGVDKLEPHDEEKVVNLRWESARDHTAPITYRIWYTTYSLKAHLANGGDLTEVAQACYMEADPTTPVAQAGSDYCIDSETTEAIHYQIIVPTAGDLYSFLVRAYDGVGNHDDNTSVQMVLPKAAPMESTETKLYLWNGTNMLEQADVSNPIWPGSSSFIVGGTEVVWQSNTTLARESMVSGISIDIMVNWGTKAALSLTAEFGYMVGSTFVRLGTMTDLEVQANSLNLARRVTRLAKFSLANYRGLVPAGARLALRFKRWDANTGTNVTLLYGDTTNKGQVLANVQPYNHQPNGTFAIQLNTPVVRAGGYIDIDWIAADPQDSGQTIHYDIFGSDDNGATYPYVIGTKLDDVLDHNGTNYGKVTWDTVGDGLTSSYNCKIKIELGDGYLYEDPSAPNYPDPFEVIADTIWSTHNIFESTTIAVDNTVDVEPPAAVTLHKAETRPKQGSVYLEWTAVGDDGLNHGTRVSYYDIRYRPDPATNGVLSEANWGTAPTVEAEGEPVPDFSGSLETYEMLGLAPEQSYDVGIKACDEVDNCSTLETYSVMTGKGGPFYCGICHSTPPDEPDTKGIHRQHGYTLVDCAKCHGDGNGIANDVKTYDGRHYNGFIDVGWAKNSDGTHAPLVQLGIESGYPDVVITQTTDGGDVTIYQDLADGAGGYNMGAGQTPTAYANTDSGTCMNFGAANANGCHGPFEPQWAPSVAVNNPQAPACSDCHGDSSATRDLDPYGRIWDCNVGGAPSELVKASPPIDNHGQSAVTSKYTGAHERHLNSSFRFAKGDSCQLCHLDTMYSGEHADGKVDIRFDNGANQSDILTATSTFNGPEATTGMSCGGLSTDSCHDTFEADGVTEKPLADWPVWNVPGAQCVSCHGMSTMGAVPHISDPINGGDQLCEYCHMAGHPQSPDGINPGDPLALLVNNNPAVGISYKSGGIHIRKAIGGRTQLNSSEPIDTLAEICWGCHEDNGVSEFGPDDGLLNAAVEPYPGVGRSMYDFGSLNQTSWANATWSSPDTNFAYKTGKLQSFHSTDPTGVATVTWDSANGRYNETPDPVAKIRCTNCHDVHDLNKADNDTVSGAPYLRGTWKSNPYEEDGAPWNKTYTAPVLPSPGFGAVPRAATTYIAKGGYFIDQNNVRPGTTTAAHYPTSGWTVSSSAGLCVLCHGADVDGMDKNAGEGLWLGTNGHSNSALGGTFKNGANIFDYSHGRPTPYNDPAKLGAIDYAQIADMAMQTRTQDTLDKPDTYLYGYRSLKNTDLTPYIGANFAYNQYQWGATIDSTITDVMYHQFSCSKCHNPHASRLPKLMITNCLDIRHNTWDDGQSMLQTLFTNTTNDKVDRSMPAAYYASAQNCHRFDPARGDEDNNNVYEDRTKRGGWNKVTPWVKNNLTNTEHKGATDPAYGTSNTTSPWRHSDFPTETSGW